MAAVGSVERSCEARVGLEERRLHRVSRRYQRCRPPDDGA
eukprot:CAMPEP_0195574278 /NCGR_PEP_ID=MMETSP0814-20130614/5861_1 /TAXON_ID=97485 /ORGANISM="Prymnesium parvum, Strain Texoma1" /LENGTH=39 /DNA_ID= /DNA_START= /DNA_END= /DNA_ORIENTATION=